MKEHNVWRKTLYFSDERGKFAKSGKGVKNTKCIILNNTKFKTDAAVAE